MFFGEQWNPFDPLPDSKSNDPKADWRAYPLPSIDGKPAKVQLQPGVSSFFVVKKGMKHPEAEIKVLNFYEKYDPFWSPDYQAKYHQGSQDPKNPKLSVPGVTSPGFKFAVIQAFSPTQNIDIYRDNQILYKTGDYTKTKMSKFTSTTSSAKLTQKRMAYMIKNNELPYDSAETFKVTDQQGTTTDQKVFDAANWPGLLWASAPFGPWGVISGYVDNKQTIAPAFVGAPTQTMASKLPTLDKLRLETFTRIIMGSSKISEFDSFVKSFNKLGGTTITKEVNAWYTKNK